jgi:hypothetical protein
MLICLIKWCAEADSSYCYEFLIVESARLRATLKGIRELLWAACSNERRVRFRDIAGDSLDRPAADPSLRLGRSLTGEARRDVDNAK